MLFRANDKDNFEFEIHNPTQKSVLCKIKLNGEYISTSGIVIKPGQRVFLERFLDSNNKFEFSTYEVKDNPENKSVIYLNGDVRIEFYNEQSYNPNYIINSVFNSGIGTTITTGSPNYGDNAFTTSSSTSFYNGVNSFSNYKTPRMSAGIRSNKSNKSIETGRIEKGEESNQNFTNSHQNFEYNIAHQISLKISPFGNKNITKDEIKHYCTECGSKTKSKYKFCPSCGNKL